MALFRFRTRSPGRDLQADIARFAKVRQALDEVCAAIEQERDGFRHRYDEVAMNAAFSLENMENEGETERVSAKIDDFSDALERFTQRIASLEKQLHFLKEIDGTVADFAAGNGFAGGGTPPQADISA
ncbi:hypothetical protein GCM10011491_39520 [Brucella endophytica]|uniref:Uncharacterized protein n=1 Tax=Brucella endophytica TaxID=1963359 RepID=A0A916SMI8_9HYPH|nr:hypothetical protein [Brucella endophytica]GGB07550.1 hypothetical protein GCM10011491_39520 [Brucella endophytica]